MNFVYSMFPFRVYSDTQTVAHNSGYNARIVHCDAVTTVYIFHILL